MANSCCCFLAARVKKLHQGHNVLPWWLGQGCHLATLHCDVVIPQCYVTSWHHFQVFPRGQDTAGFTHSILASVEVYRGDATSVIPQFPAYMRCQGWKLRPLANGCFSIVLLSLSLVSLFEHQEMNCGSPVIWSLTHGGQDCQWWLVMMATWYLQIQLQFDTKYQWQGSNDGRDMCLSLLLMGFPDGPLWGHRMLWGHRKD